MTKLNPALKINQRDSVRQEISIKSVKTDNSSIGKESKSDRVSLSESYKTKPLVDRKGIASDIRFDLVKKYREVLADGSYQVKSDELADKIVQKVKENKNANSSIHTLDRVYRLKTTYNGVIKDIILILIYVFPYEK